MLGPLSTWLSAFATASAGNTEGAKGKTASVDPPPATAPLEARVVAAAAFGAMKDKRRGIDYVKEVLSSGSQNPDSGGGRARAWFPQGRARQASTDVRVTC